MQRRNLYDQRSFAVSDTMLRRRKRLVLLTGITILMPLGLWFV